MIHTIMNECSIGLSRLWWSSQIEGKFLWWIPASISGHTHTYWTRLMIMIALVFIHSLLWASFSHPVKACYWDYFFMVKSRHLIISIRNTRKHSNPNTNTAWDDYYSETRIIEQWMGILRLFEFLNFFMSNFCSTGVQKRITQKNIQQSAMVRYQTE